MKKGEFLFNINLRKISLKAGFVFICFLLPVSLALTCDAATLSVSLEAIPNSGTAPLSSVALKATVSGSASGPITYRFDCTDNGSWEYTFTNISDNSKTVAGACGYSAAGSYTAKVEVRREDATALATAQITASSPTTPAPTIPTSTTAAPTVDLRANGSDSYISIKRNSAATLSWTSANADHCYAYGDWSGTKSINYGSQSTGNLTSAKTYGLTCSGKGGTVSDTITVSVEQSSPTVDIKANGSDAYATVNYNSSANLTWTSSNVDHCYASGDWTGSKSINYGYQSTGNLTSTKNYTLTCVSKDGVVSDSVRVNVFVETAANLTSQGVINLSITKLVRNITTNTGFFDRVSAKPSDMLEFSIRVTSGGNSIAQDVIVRDFLPSKIIYQGSLSVDGVSNNGDIIAGFNAGSFFPGQPKTITFRAIVASDQQFVYGTTNLIDTAMAYNTYASVSDTAQVNVFKTGILGTATQVGTGISERLLDYIFLPFFVALLITLVFKKYLVLADDWMEKKRDKTFKSFSGRQLEKTILKTKNKERI